MWNELLFLQAQQGESSVQYVRMKIALPVWFPFLIQPFSSWEPSATCLISLSPRFLISKMWVFDFQGPFQLYCFHVILLSWKERKSSSTNFHLDRGSFMLFLCGQTNNLNKIWYHWYLHQSIYLPGYVISRMPQRAISITSFSVFCTWCVMQKCCWLCCPSILPIWYEHSKFQDWFWGFFRSLTLQAIVSSLPSYHQFFTLKIYWLPQVQVE